MRFCDNTEQFYIVDSHIDVNNNIKGKNCYVPTATMVSEIATVLRYTYIVYLVQLRFNSNELLNKVLKLL